MTMVKKINSEPHKKYWSETVNGYTPVELELDAELELDNFSNSKNCCYIEDISTSNLS